MAENNAPKRRTSLVLPEAQTAFAWLTRARPGDDDNEAAFSVMLVWPGDTDLTDLKKAIVAVAKEKWGDRAVEAIKAKRIANPLRSGDELEGEEFHGTRFINARRKESLGPPGIVDAAVRPITDPNEIYSGMFVNASVSLYAYDRKGKKGVGIGLNNIQKTRDGERKSGKPDPKNEFQQLKGSAAAAADVDDDDLFD